MCCCRTPYTMSLCSVCDAPVLPHAVTPQLTIHGRYPRPSPSPPPLGLLSPKLLARWRSPSYQRQVTGLSLRHTPPFRASRLCSVCCMIYTYVRTCTYSSNVERFSAVMRSICVFVYDYRLLMHLKQMLCAALGREGSAARP